MAVPELRAKHQILLRQTALISAELDAWVAWTAAGSTLARNFSQIEALDYFMRRLCQSNERSVSALDPAGNADVFLDNTLGLTANLIKFHAVWEFFRDRLELRFVPLFQQSLLMADLVSYDCYRTITDRAEALQIIPVQGFRGYPLIGLVTQFSPATWPRGWRPPALQNHCLPVPVIDLPWDHLANPWELLTIAHEVGHDVDEDLGDLTQALQPAITDQMNRAKIPAARFVQWQKWTSEILADLVGVLLVGPAFVGALAGLLTLPRHYVRQISDDDEHPPPYLRVFINTALARRLGLAQYAADLERGWQAIYGEPGPNFSPYLADIEPVISTILEAPLTALRDQSGREHSLSDLIPFKPEYQEGIQDATAKLVAGGLPAGLPIRHVVSASQLAFEHMVGGGNGGGLEGLARRTRQAIVGLAPEPQLGGPASQRVQRHLDDLADRLLERPLEDLGLHFPVAKEGR